MRFTAQADGRLLDLLQARFPEASRTTLRRMLGHGRVGVDGAIARRGDEPVRAGQEIEVSARARRAPEPPCRIVLRDDHLLAVEKPPGILSVARDPALDDTIYRRLNEYVGRTSAGRERVFIVHRLDREASGLMLFALSAEIQEALQRDWKRTEKRYWALVEGRPPEREGTVRGWLRENAIHRVYCAPPGAGARLAVTRYRLRVGGAGHSLLDIRIETGRKNQIRVHMADLGCPIAGDRKYGARGDPLGRLALHAYLLAFTHPVSRERIRLRLPLPAAFRISGLRGG